MLIYVCMCVGDAAILIYSCIECTPRADGHRAVGAGIATALASASAYDKVLYCLCSLRY